MMTESPYITHREILLNGKYSTAYRLQEFLLYQLNPWQYPFDVDQHLGGFDSLHMQIFKDMKLSYCYNGSASEGFKDLAETIEARMLKEAQSLRDDLIRLRQMRPGDYPYNKDEDPLKSYQLDVELHEMHYRRCVEKGYLDE